MKLFYTIFMFLTFPISFPTVSVMYLVNKNVHYLGYWKYVKIAFLG